MAPAVVGLEHHARDLHRAREEDEQDEVGDDDHREHGLAQPSARARVGDHRGGHRRREADDNHDQQRDHGQPRRARRLRRHREPGPRDPQEYGQASHGDGERGARHLDDGHEPPAHALQVERQPGDERDERRRDPGDHLELAGHRLGDDVADVRTDDDAEQQVAGQPREVEAAEDVAGDPRADEREAKRERGAGRAVAVAAPIVRTQITAPTASAIAARRVNPRPPRSLRTSPRAAGRSRRRARRQPCPGPQSTAAWSRPASRIGTG